MKKCYFIFKNHAKLVRFFRKKNILVKSFFIPKDLAIFFYRQTYFTSSHSTGSLVPDISHKS
jgi:hypothetical protein